MNSFQCLRTQLFFASSEKLEKIKIGHNSSKEMIKNNIIIDIGKYKER